MHCGAGVGDGLGVVLGVGLGSVGLTLGVGVGVGLGVGHGAGSGAGTGWDTMGQVSVWHMLLGPLHSPWAAVQRPHSQIMQVLSGRQQAPPI